MAPTATARTGAAGSGAGCWMTGGASTASTGGRSVSEAARTVADEAESAFAWMRRDSSVAASFSSASLILSEEREWRRGSELRRGSGGEGVEEREWSRVKERE